MASGSLGGSVRHVCCAVGLCRIQKIVFFDCFSCAAGKWTSVPLSAQSRFAWRTGKTMQISCFSVFSKVKLRGHGCLFFIFLHLQSRLIYVCYFFLCKHYGNIMETLLKHSGHI